MGVIERKNLAEPDVVRELDHATLTLTRVGTHSVGTGVLQPCSTAIPEPTFRSGIAR